MCARAAHPLAEVRRRAVQSLNFKFKNGLVGRDELLNVGGWLTGSC